MRSTVTESSLGGRVRTLRKERGLSQRELAERADLSPNAVSLIERDEISPSVATLQRLAAALNVRMGYFFDTQAGTRTIHSRPASRPRLANSGGTIEGLGARLAGQQMEPFIITLAAQADANRDLVVHTGHELVYCLAGRVEYEIDGAIYVLEPGDQLMFQAEQPHRWRNLDQQAARLLLVLQDAHGPRDPARQHFFETPSVADLG